MTRKLSYIAMVLSSSQPTPFIKRRIQPNPLSLLLLRWIVDEIRGRVVVSELPLAGLAGGREISSLAGTLAGRRAESSGGLQVQ